MCNSHRRDLIFWDSTGESSQATRCGRVLSLAMWSCRRASSKQRSLSQGRTAPLEREGLLWGDGECCQIVSDQSQKGNITASCYITPPRLQLVLGYFLSQIAYPRKAATAQLLPLTRARSSLNRQRSFAVWAHCYQPKLAGFHLDWVVGTCWLWFEGSLNVGGGGVELEFPEQTEPMLSVTSFSELRMELWASELLQTQ